MGEYCKKPNHVLASGWVDNDPRFNAEDISLHCYIWTSNDDSSRRADLCSWCCEHVILGRPSINDVELPINLKRDILKMVSWGSWW